MTRDDIIRAAEEIGLRTGDNQPGRYRSQGVNLGITLDDLLLFASAIAAREREECAIAAEQVTARRRFVRAAINGEKKPEPCPAAAAIRARSNHADQA